MGPTAGFSGLALIIGISEGTLGGLVGVQAFFAAADHVAVWGARVKSMELFGYNILALFLVYTAVDLLADGVPTARIYFLS